MTDNQKAVKTARQNYKASKLNAVRHNEGRNALIKAIENSKVPNWNVRISLLKD